MVCAELATMSSNDLEQILNKSLLDYHVHIMSNPVTLSFHSLLTLQRTYYELTKIQVQKLTLPGEAIPE